MNAEQSSKQLMREPTYSPRTGRAYIGTYPSKKRVKRLCREISELTVRRWVLKDMEERVTPSVPRTQQPPGKLL